MALKRQRHDDGEAATQQRKKLKRQGFQVGPQNLPDGPYRRKNQKTKHNLIARAQLEKSYAKLKRRNNLSQEHDQTRANTKLSSEEVSDTQASPEQHDSAAVHPDREALVNSTDHSRKPSSSNLASDDDLPLPNQNQKSRPRPSHKNKLTPFHRAEAQGQRRRAEVEAQKQRRAEQEAQKRAREDERQRLRISRAKEIRNRKDGTRGMRWESRRLLEKVKRMVD